MEPDFQHDAPVRQPHKANGPHHKVLKKALEVVEARIEAIGQERDEEEQKMAALSIALEAKDEEEMYHNLRHRVTGFGADHVYEVLAPELAKSL